MEHVITFRMGYTPKPPTSIQFTDYVWVYEKSDALADLLKRIVKRGIYVEFF